MSRILISARLYGPGGVETHLLNLGRVLVEAGAEVTLVSRCARDQAPLVQQAREIPIRLLRTPFAKDLRWFRLSTAWAMLFWPPRLGRFDVLYTFDFSGFTRFLTRFLRPGGRIVGSRVGEMASPGEPSLRYARQLLDGLIVESEPQAEAARRELQGDVPVAAFPLLGLISQAPARRPFRAEPLRLAFLGRFDHLKGVHRLLRIWPALEIGPARLDFYGSGPEEAALRAAIQDRGLQEQVQVHGGWTTAEELGAIFDSTDLVVLPSETEGLPVILLEAMAHGVPFVASDVGAVRTLAEQNPDVRVVPLDDAAIKQAIEEMAAAIRARQVRGDRLQQYHAARYGFEQLRKKWVQALLHPDEFWATGSASATL